MVISEKRIESLSVQRVTHYKVHFPFREATFGVYYRENGQRNFAGDVTASGYRGARIKGRKKIEGR